MVDESKTVRFIYLFFPRLIVDVPFLSIYPHRLSEERSEERFSRNAETDLVCRLLLEKRDRRAASPRRPRHTGSWRAPPRCAAQGSSQWRAFPRRPRALAVLCCFF